MLPTFHKRCNFALDQANGLRNFVAFAILPKTLLVLEGNFFYLTKIANFYLASFLFNCLLVFFTIKYTVIHTTKYTTTKIAVKIATTCHWNGIQELAR